MAVARDETSPFCRFLGWLSTSRLVKVSMDQFKDCERIANGEARSGLKSLWSQMQGHGKEAQLEDS
jgi:hypothetical protein